MGRKKRKRGWQRRAKLGESRTLEKFNPVEQSHPTNRRDARRRVTW